MNSSMPITDILYGKKTREHNKQPSFVRRAGSRVFEVLPDEQFEELAHQYPNIHDLKKV